MENENEMTAEIAAEEKENCCCCSSEECAAEPLTMTEGCDCSAVEPVTEEEIVESVIAIDEETEAAEEAAADADDNADAEKESCKAERIATPVTDEMLGDVRKKFATMLDYLGFEDATVRAESNVPGKINLIVASKDAGRIIGRKGQNLENLQLILNRMMQKNDVNYPKVFVDIDGYSSQGNGKRGEHGDRGDRSEQHGNRRDRGDRRDRRDRRDRGDRGDRRDRRDRGDRRDRHDNGHDENLRNMALDFAKEVRRWGEPKTLPAMNAHDRRIIHLTLEKEVDITTDSVGQEPNKSVVISMKK